ncbi:MAG TPA: hypothetical protein VHZ04_01360 [Candidatus Paceibacterota bacterium]|nr:hypothetical protein [Candidatus Paceibacterota bacterium]
MKLFKKVVAGSLKLGFGVSDMASEGFGNFMVLQPKNCPEQEYFFLARREVVNTLLEKYPFRGEFQVKIPKRIKRLSPFPELAPFFVAEFEWRGHQTCLLPALTQMHQHIPGRYAIEPRGELGISPELAYLFPQVDECILSKILGVSGVADHAQAKQVCPLPIENIQFSEQGATILGRTADATDDLLVGQLERSRQI